MKYLLTLGLMGALAMGCGADAGLEADGAEDATQESAVESTGDRADLSLRVITDFSIPSTVGQTETRRLFTSQASFRAYFGASLPGVDFSRQWVAFYSAGVKRTGGYAASFTHIRPSSSGLTLKITTRLESPGEGCLVTQSLTRPTALVVFTVPRLEPSYGRYYRDDTTRDCAVRPSCNTVRCTATTHCELVPVTCVRAPCYPQAQCVPNVTPCATVRCAAGTHCVDTSGSPVCTPDVTTCAATLCAVNTHCVETSTGAVCEPNVTPCATVRCAAGTHCVDTSGSAVCTLDPGACLTAADCLLYENYCGGCVCNALGHNQRPVTCSNPVMCLRQPCGGLTASCNASTHRCEALAPTR